jgi:uncharacterized protein YidB (DUF937 family)
MIITIWLTKNRISIAGYTLGAALSNFGTSRMSASGPKAAMTIKPALWLLSGELLDAIDKLTPNGRIPTDEELSREA